ncbi:MAG TPA: DNA ligase [Nannocystis exedens]|nr:DNA ligase [Nannocystis exedens]
MIKYPRTHHVVGSRLQHGDHNLAAIPFAAICGQKLVVEEKMDGANTALSFTQAGELLLQSRGHYLTGGPRERHFDLFKQWANTHADTLHAALGARFVMYGEWLYAKHTCFYDALPHYFMEFDIYDRQEREFMSTHRRRQLLAGLPVVSVAVLWQGIANHLRELTSRVGPSLFKTSIWREALLEAASAAGVGPEQVLAETDREDTMEGLYIKVEANGRVMQRLKWVRPSFLSAIQDSGSHWLARPIIANKLADGVDLWTA